MARVDDLAHATGGVAPADFTPNTYEELGYMLGKLAFQLIREVVAENPLADFEKVPVNTGDTIEQAIVELAVSSAYDPDGADALKREDPSIIVKYFNDWSRKKFKTTVDISQIRKVLMSGSGTAELSSRIVSSLAQGDTYEKYLNTRDLFKWGRQDQTGKVLKKLNDIAYNNGIDYQALLVQLKDTVKGMTYVNTDYNTASLNRATPSEDIRIIMPYKLKNRIDVEELSGVFNLQKAEIEKKIIEIDVETEEISGVDCYPVYVVDKNAVVLHTRLYEMIDEKNADGLFWNYYLHVERMFGLTSLFDGCYFFVKTEASA